MTIWRDVVPELQQYCWQHDAEFMLIDPFQVRSRRFINITTLLQSTNTPLEDDPLTLEVLCDEVAQCASLSSGPFFVVNHVGKILKTICTLQALCGERYGEPAPPALLRQDEFTAIRAAAVDGTRGALCIHCNEIITSANRRRARSG